MQLQPTIRSHKATISSLLLVLRHKYSPVCCWPALFALALLAVALSTGLPYMCFHVPTSLCFLTLQTPSPMCPGPFPTPFAADMFNPNNMQGSLFSQFSTAIPND